ncbi:MFS transporter [bacterium]|nr:MFS transporter [bacterium]
MPTAAPRRRLINDPGFLRLWTAESISHLGSSFSALAMPIVAIQLLHAGPMEIAIINLADTLPFLVIGLLVGALIDRLPRRGVLIVADLGRAVLLLTIPIGYALGLLSVPQLVIVGLLLGTLTVFFDVAYQAYLPSLIPKGDLVEGNSKLEISRSAAGLFGPSLAGALIAIVKAPMAVIIDALSFALSALFLFTIKPTHEFVAEQNNASAPAAQRPRNSLRSEIVAGLRYVFSHPALRTIGGATATSNLFSGIAGTVELLFAYNVLGLSVALIGFAATLGSAGGLISAVFADKISKRLGVGRTIVLTIPLGGPMIAVLAFCQPGNDLLNALVIGAGFFAGAASGTLYNINQVSLRQALTPPEMSGRMNATMRWFVWGTIPIGALLGGALGTSLGLRETLLIAGIGGSFAFVPLLFGPVWRIKEMPTGVAEK